MNIKNGKIKSGFALIEIMVVVAILSVAAAILVPRFLKHELEKKRSECLKNLQSLVLSEKAYFEKNGTYTEDLNALNWKPTGSLYEYRFIAASLANRDLKKEFIFECSGNIDHDLGLDHITIDQDGVTNQIADDITGGI